MKTTLEIKTNRNTFLFQVDQRESQEKRGEKKLHSLPDLTILPTVNSVDVYTNILSIIILPTDLRMETICKKTSLIISDMLVSLSLIKKKLPMALHMDNTCQKKFTRFTPLVILSVSYSDICSNSSNSLAYIDGIISSVI